MRGLFRLTPSRSAHVRLSPPRFSQARPGNPQPFPPRFSQEIPETVQNRRKYLVLPGKPGNPTKSQKITPNFSQEISEPPHNRRKSLLSWENLGEPGGTWENLGEPGGTWENLGEPGGTWVETVGNGDFSGGPGRAAKVSSGKSGWRVGRYFYPQFLHFCRRRCRPLWPAGLPRVKI